MSSDQYFQEELVVPAGEFAFAFEGALSGIGLKQIEGDPPQAGEVLGPMSLS